MIFVKPRHKPVFDMSIVRNICSFAELNFFNDLNKGAQDFALSLETTCRVNELNQKIIVRSDHFDFGLQRSEFLFEHARLHRNLEKLLGTLEKFNSEIIEYKSPNDLKSLNSGNYLIYSQSGQVPNLDFCHAFFAIENNVKLEIGLNKFQEISSGGQTLVGAVIL